MVGRSVFGPGGRAAGAAGSARYIPDLRDNVLEGRIHPERVFDFESHLDGIAEAYAAMDECRAIKSLAQVNARFTTETRR